MHLRTIADFEKSATKKKGLRDTELTPQYFFLIFVFIYVLVYFLLYIGESKFYSIFFNFAF